MTLKDEWTVNDELMSDDRGVQKDLHSRGKERAASGELLEYFWSEEMYKRRHSVSKLPLLPALEQVRNWPDQSWALWIWKPCSYKTVHSGEYKCERRVHSLGTVCISFFFPCLGYLIDRNHLAVHGLFSLLFSFSFSYLTSATFFKFKEHIMTNYW